MQSGSRRGYLLALIAGFITVPIVALATGLIWSLPNEEQAQALPSGLVPPSEPLPIGAASRQGDDDSTVDQTLDLEADLAEACGPAGLELVSLEESEQITPLEQGVLDALREVCSANEMTLPPGPPLVVTQEVIVVERVVTGPSSSPSTTGDQGPSDDEEEEEEDDEESDDDD